MKIHHLQPADVLQSLHTRQEGLSPHEAARRLREYGPNRLAEARRTPLWLRLLREFTHFFALLLWSAAALAFMADWQAPGQGMATLGWAVIGVILINGGFSFWQEYRAERAIEALQRLLPLQVKVIRAGELHLMEADGLVPGDVILLQEGDNIPADARLIESVSLRVNNATVTGESRPQARDAEACSEETLIHASNVLLTGTAVVSGHGRAVVFHTGMRTEFGKIAALTQRVGEVLSPLQVEIIRLSRIVGVLAVGLGGAFFLLGRMAGLPFWQDVVFAIGIIVANVPEGLLPTVTLSLAMATQRLARRKVLIRHLPAVETLGSATVICTDKTGTLTLNRMTVRQLFLGGEMRAIDQVDAEQTATYAPLWACARLCQDLKRTGTGSEQRWLGDPMEVALVEMAERLAPVAAEWQRAGDWPFDTDRKRMTVACDGPEGRFSFTKGALDTVLPLCTRVLTATGVVNLDTAGRALWQQAERQMAEAGLRVLALAYRAVEAGADTADWERDLILVGLVALEDPPRPEVPAAIRRCHAAGIRVIMVTGDHPHTALAIGREIGMIRGTQPQVLSGEQLLRLSDTQLQLALDHEDILFARLGADQKMRIVEALKRKGQIVAVTGDGVNDAPALRKADIGVAMGVNGTDVAKESADMILLDDHFAGIVAAVEEGRAVFGNLRNFITYILTSNIAELVPYLAFALLGIPLPLTVIQILLVDLGTDMIPALGLGADKPDPTAMQHPPRSRDEKLLTVALLLRAYLFLGVLEAALSMAAYFYVLHAGGWQYGQALASDDPLYRQATTACLSAIIVGQMINVFLCKQAGVPLLRTSWFNNRLILLGVAVELVLILWIDYTGPGQEVFGTADLSLDAWGFILAMAPLMVVCEAVRRWLVVGYRGWRGADGTET